MNTGIENKKQLGALIVLGVVAAYVIYTNFLAGPSSAPTPAVRPGDTATATAPVSGEKPASGSGPDISRTGQQTARPGKGGKNNEFHPVLRSKKKEERAADIGLKDPSLRLDLLAKVMQVPPAGGERDLFQILKGPPVKAADLLAKKDEPKVYQFVGPKPPPPPPPPAPPPPPPTIEPVPLKYFGLSTLRPDGKRTAYFMDSEDNILEAIEGTMLKGRYRIIQIGFDKVLVEDTQQKRRQSINLEPEVTG